MEQNIAQFSNPTCNRRALCVFKEEISDSWGSDIIYRLLNMGPAIGS